MSAEGASLMWKLARKAVADTSALPRSTAVPWWEQSFLFPIKRSTAEHLLAHSRAIGTNPTAYYPVPLAEVRALHGAAVQALLWQGSQRGFHLCQGQRAVGQEGKIYRKHLGIAKLRKKAAGG